MSDSENATVSESEKVTASDSHPDIDPAFRPHQDPRPTPRELGYKVDDDVREELAVSGNTYDDNESKEVNVEIEKDERDEQDKKDSEKPLLEEESIKIDIVKPGYEGEDTATLPISEKKKKSKGDIEKQEKRQRDKLPVYLFPFTRIKDAWSQSTNICTFLGTVVCIIFQTVGWFTCVGGIPFLSLVMLIIGSLYVHDCKVEPNIPVYLIVSGVIGTVQHIITIWTKYVPKESQGRLKVYRSYCRLLNGLFHIFLIIWFILGCVWVYGVKEVEFRDTHKDEYCHKTLYYFAFWILNLSFILLMMLVVLSICFLICVVVTPKNEEKGIVQ